MAKRLIQQLNDVRGMKVECPSCSETFSVSRAKLFSMYDPYSAVVTKILGERREVTKELIEDAKQRRQQLALDRKQRPQRIISTTQGTNFGQNCEQIIPAFTTFPYAQRDCRTLFKPIDYIVFKGVSATGRVEAIKFVEFKTGGGVLGKKQRMIRDCVAYGKVKHEVIEL
jgi:predicted Holliday junction resolvase-like endonuclease